MTWQRLIRFEDDNGTIQYGDARIDSTKAVAIDDLVKQGSLQATCYVGSSIFSLESTDRVANVKRLLNVLTADNVSIVKCVGLNYMKHIQEGGRKPPPYPSIFIKPRHSLAAYDEDIPIPTLAQDDQLDYEGELAIIIGKSGKDIAKSDAISHVAGYVAANDVSARKWQRDPAFAGGVPQWCFSKGFDKFAPLSPMVVSPSVVGNAGNLRLQTSVNGDIRQDTMTDDLLFNVESIVSFISQGTTLEAGTVIMTGTPSGVAMGMGEPKWLRNGDEVEVSIESLGRVRNRMAFV